MRIVVKEGAGSAGCHVLEGSLKLQMYIEALRGGLDFSKWIMIIVVNYLIN